MAARGARGHVGRRVRTSVANATARPVTGRAGVHCGTGNVELRQGGASLHGIAGDVRREHPVQEHVAEPVDAAAHARDDDRGRRLICTSGGGAFQRAGGRMAVI
jgi:hypothetical protein